MIDPGSLNDKLDKVIFVVHYCSEKVFTPTYRALLLKCQILSY